MNEWWQQRFRPSLLEKLTDRQPRRKKESEADRASDLADYRNSVIRDLARLFSTGAPPKVQPKRPEGVTVEYCFQPHQAGEVPPGSVSPPPGGWLDIRPFRRAARSVLCYGLRHGHGILEPWDGRLARGIRDAVEVYEPRVKTDSVEVRVNPETQFVEIVLKGQLVTFPESVPFSMRARINRQNGEVSVA